MVMTCVRIMFCIPAVRDLFASASLVRCHLSLHASYACCCSLFCVSAPWASRCVARSLMVWRESLRRRSLWSTSLMHRAGEHGKLYSLYPGLYPRRRAIWALMFSGRLILTRHWAARLFEPGSLGATGKLQSALRLQAVLAGSQPCGPPRNLSLIHI